MNNKTIIIKAENLSYSYPGQQNAIISNLNFTIKKGERIAITGKSGIGKSTLLKLFAGLLHNFSGTIVNNSLCQGYMFQDAYLYPWLNVYDNVVLGLKILKKPLQRKRVMEMLEWAGIEDFAFQPPGSLSGGQRQRAALVRTLITKPDIIMLDEAFSSLDSETTKQLQADIIEYSEKNSIALLLVTHDYNEAFHMANEVVYLQRQIIDGEAQTVLQNVAQKLEQSPEQSKSEYKIYTQTNHAGKNIEIPFFSPKNKLAQLQNTGC